MRLLRAGFAVSILVFGSASLATAATQTTVQISGTPVTSAVAGAKYSFHPVATGGSAKIRYFIRNRPVWASFSGSLGWLWGTPTVAGVYTGIRIYATDGTSTVSVPAFSLTVKAATALQISGTPPATVQVGKPYSFRPTVSNASGTLTFTITNMPSWLTFDPSTGALSGTPKVVGSSSNIILGASSGSAKAQLAPFAITVSAATATRDQLSLVIAGSGTVSDSAGAFGCGTSCTQMINDGATVSLKAAASTGYKFDSWSGQCSGAAACQFVMKPNLSVSATFSKIVVVTPPTTPVPPTQTPPAAGTPYPGFTYKLPTVRPFISLNQYAAASANSAAVVRFKAHVDDVVAITKAAGPSVTYDTLLNSIFNNHYDFSPVDSVIMFRLTGNTDYIDQAIRLMDLYVTAENAAIASGSTPRIASDSYLDVGRYLSELSLTYDYGYNRLSAGQRTAWNTFAERTLFNLWNPNSATWGSVSRPWSGWSINDPGNNYYYSFLKATQLWALASQNPTWISFLQTQKYTQLVPFFSLLTGGGSREGTGYGTALGSMFEDYAYWKDSTGEDLSALSSHARDTIDYWVHATVPTFEYFASIGDQSRSSMTTLFDYHRKLVLEGVALSPSSAQGQRGLWWLNRAKVTDGGNGWVLGGMRYNFNYRYDLLAGAGSQQAPTTLMYNSTGTGALFARSDWGTSASWMHTNVGRYDQSHAHQDQGTFSFFKGTWLAITSNVFSNSGINQGTEVENVLRFDLGSNPIPQNYSLSTKTVTDSGATLQIDANLTPAYSNHATNVSRWTRQFTYQRSAHTLTIHDLCSVGTGVTPVWQLHTPVQPVRQADGTYLAGTLRIKLVQPTAPAVTVVNMKNTSSDFASGYRLELRNSSGSCEFVVGLTAQ